MAVSPTLLIHQPDVGSLTAEHLLAPGMLLGDGGRYRISGIIAIGGMATVYEAVDERLEMPCAMKALYLPGVDDSSEIESFRRESQLLASLHFPGIVAVRDCFVEAEFAFLVMDFIDGQNLYDRHRRTGRLGEDTQDVSIAPVPEDQVAHYGIALASALHYLHTRTNPIVYRDMKPHNVMRRASDGKIVLLDFGIARKMRTGAKSCKSDDLGTPGYAAPEQYERAGIIDARTDIYSLGVLLTELATGYNPRESGASRHVPALAELPVQMSPMLGSILQKCLAIQPKDRYATAEALGEALERWLDTPRQIRRRSLPKRIWKFYTNARAAGPIVAASGTVYAADAKGSIYALDIAVGHVDAEQDFPVSDRAPSARYALSAFIGDTEGTAKLALTVNFVDKASLMLFDQNLSPLQRVVSKGKLLTAWSSPDAIALVSSDPGEIAMMACVSKREWHYNWRSKLNFAAVSVGMCLGNPLLLDSSGTVRCYDAASGSVLWEQWVCGRASPRVICSTGDLVLIGGCKGDTSLTALDARSGKVYWHAPGVGVSLAAPIVSADGKIIVAATLDSGISLLDLKRGTVLSRLSEFTMPIVGATHFEPACDVIAFSEYGERARAVLFDVARRKIVWSEPLGDTGAVAPPVITGDTVILQESSGCISAWEWGKAR